MFLVQLENSVEIYYFQTLDESRKRDYEKIFNDDVYYAYGAAISSSNERR